MIEVVWRMSYDDEEFEENIITEEPQTTLLPDHMDCEGNAEAAVGDIACDWWRTSGHWDDDEHGDDIQVFIEVTAPESIAGMYVVAVEKVIQARAARLP